MFKTLSLLLVMFLAIDTVNLIDIPFISDIQDLIGLAHDIGDIASGNVPLKSLFVKTVNPINVIMDTVTQLVDQVTNLGDELNQKLDSILNTVLVRVPLEGKIDDDMKEIIKYMAKIDDEYDNFEIYTEFPDDFGEKTLKSHISHVVGSSSGDIQDILHSMLLIIVPPKSAIQRASLLENIKQLRIISDNTELCDLDLSFQYRLYKIYNIFMITELKAFIMTQFAYKQMGEFDNTVYTGEIKKSLAKYIMRSSQYQKEIKKIMQGASREIYRCPPSEFIYGETYVEFKGLFSSYVINEMQMGAGNCKHTCFDWQSIDYHRKSYHHGVWNYETFNMCNGRIKDCGWIGGIVNMCENFAGSEERYQFVKSKTNGYYGEWTQCIGGTNREIWSFSMDAFWRCDICMCTCLEEKAESIAIRTINLRPQLSNIEENKVVSNLRFVSKDKIIHIQIEEAPLLPVGLLDRHNTTWVPLEDFVYYSNLTEEGSFMLKNGNEYIELTKDVDYSFIKYERKRLNLDEISASPGYVVTGVRFNFETPLKENNVNHNPYQLEIHVTPFNFTTGLLIPTDDNPSIWLTPTTQPIPPVEYSRQRTEQLNAVKVKFNDAGSFNPIPMKNKYIDFSKSGIENVGKSTVPFFDARPVITDYNLAFDGIGMIFHENNKKHAGLIALKVMTIDHARYVKPNFKNSQLKYYRKLYRGPLRYDPAV